MAKSQTQIERELEELAECSIMLENSLAPYIDAPDVNRWLEERRLLLEEIRRTLDDGNNHEENTKEIR